MKDQKMTMVVKLKLFFTGGIIAVLLLDIFDIGGEPIVPMKYLLYILIFTMIWTYPDLFLPKISIPNKDNLEG